MRLRGGGMKLYFRNSILTVQVNMDNNRDQSEPLCCNLASLNSLITDLIDHKPHSAKVGNNQI